jgi:hypothetical protein
VSNTVQYSSRSPCYPISMDSPHVPPDRLRRLMCDYAVLTEEESDHLREWQCEVCKDAMQEAVLSHLDRQLSTSK